MCNLFEVFCACVWNRARFFRFPPLFLAAFVVHHKLLSHALMVVFLYPLSPAILPSSYISLCLFYSLTFERLRSYSSRSCDYTIFAAAVIVAACFVSAWLQPISTPKTIQFDFVLKGIFCFGVLLHVQSTSFCRSGWFLVYTSSAALAHDREIESKRAREQKRHT